MDRAFVIAGRARAFRVEGPLPRQVTRETRNGSVSASVPICYPSGVWQLEGAVLEQRSWSIYSILTVEAPAIAETALPGQFVMAAPHSGSTVPAPLLKRALAVYGVIHRAGEPSAITLLLKVVGEGTKRLALVRRGETIDLVGPLGVGFDLQRAAGKLNLIVAGGTGIASVRLLAERLLHCGEEVRLLYGGRSRQDLVGLDDFSKLQMEVIPVTEDGSLGVRGLVTDGLRTALQRLPAGLVNVYTCGPNRMMQAVSEMALAAGIPCQISVEMKMACGFGVCLGCTVKTRESYRLACTHGPVFDAHGFVWEPIPQVETAG